VAIGLAEREAPAALVVESTFSTLPDVGARAYPWLPVKLISRMRYDSVRRVKHLRCPILVMHAPDDDVVPIELARTLYDAAAEPKRFVELEGGHGGGFLTDLAVYRRAWDEILGVAGLRSGDAPRDL
jgi:hypothetical protein